MKVGHYVKGINSPFVHGKIMEINGKFAYLDNGSTYPLSSLQKSSKKENATLPDFKESLRDSKSGLNIFK